MVFLIMGSLGAHPGPLTSFNEMVQLLKPARSRVGKVTDKKMLARLFTSTSPVVLHVGSSAGLYAKKLLHVCGSLSTTLPHIRFFSLADQLTAPFLHYVGSKLAIDKVELPCLIMLHKGQLVLPIIAGFLQEPQLRSLLIGHFGVQAGAEAVGEVVN